MLLLIHVLEERGYRSQVQELRPGGRLGGGCRLHGGKGQLCWRCRNDSGCERWVGGPLSQLSLSPGRVIKITAICGIQALLNLACPPPSQLPSTLAAQLTGMGTGRAASPASEMFVLSRSLAVNDFLRGGSSPGTRSQRSTSSCRMPCVLAAIGCRELCPLLWGSCQSSLSAGKEGRGFFPFPVSPILPRGYPAPWGVGSSTMVGWELPFGDLRSWHRSGISCQPCWQVSVAVSCSSLVLLLLGTCEQPGMGHVPSGTCWKPAWQPATTPRQCHSTRGLCDCGNGSKGGGLGKFCTRGCRKGSGVSSRT